mgnify:CR=1 FL=1
MSIFDIKISEYPQQLISKKEDKQKYGEINTPFSLVEKIFDLFPHKIFENPNLKWLDPGTGEGYFMMILYKRLYYGLIDKFPNPQKRSEHIIKNMLYMCEINSKHKQKLESLFGKNMNVQFINFLDKAEGFEIEYSAEPKIDGISASLIYF